MDSNHRDAAVWTGGEVGEIESHAAQLLHMDLGLTMRTDRGPEAEAGDVVIGTPASNATIAAEAGAWKLDVLGPEGFVVEHASISGAAVQVVAANSPRGALYGCVALADAVRLGLRRESVRLRERPTFVHRNLWT